MERPKQKRNRRPKACQPCRDRKVRCDQEEPCDTCIRRGHPGFCVYGKRRNDAGAAVLHAQSPRNTLSTEASSLPDFDTLDSSNLDFDFQNGPLNPSRPAFPGQRSEHTNNHNDDQLIQTLETISSNLTNLCRTDRWTGEVIFLGRNASASFFSHLSHPTTKTPLSQVFMPFNVSWGAAFGLTNRTTLHPFGSLWASAGSTTLTNILQALPATEICMTYYRTYQKVVAPFYPFVLDLEAFESRLCTFLPKLAEMGLECALQAAITDGTFRDAAWYGLFFGILAAGCQFSDAPVTVRLPRTRVFVACAFECLRLANLYGCPSAEVIQTMLLIASTIANDCNPGVALSLIGMTAQQARSLGLHVAQTSTSGDQDEVHPLWRAIMALESTLSLAFDRPPVSALSFVPSSEPSSFQEIMHNLHAQILDWQSTTTSNTTTTTTPTSTYITTLETLDSQISTQPSTTIQCRLEALIYKIHSQNFLASLYRHSALTKKSPSHYYQMLQSHRLVLEAFLELRNLVSPLALTSWSILHCSMSSACLLATLSLENQEDKNLLLRKQKVLKDEVERLDDDEGVIARSSLPYGSFLNAFNILMDGAPMKEGGWE